ncbi:MAG: hypothetical protein H6610_05285 [Ignavibacteriales bacterium]|nr:hypothetical protein [Ignavibacteriales bacterium]MCB9218854.1 hypothetical protein [Ignavibacteriales bacterium]
MNKTTLKIFLFVSISSTIFASGGSLYSRYGLGDLFYSASARQLSLGGMTNSLSFGNYVNINNPASMFEIKETRFGAGINTNISYLDDGLNNALYSNVKFSGFHIAFPIQEDYGSSFFIGLTPYSNVNYEVNNTALDLNSESYEEKFVGSGGISKIFFGASFVLPYDIAIGTSFNYLTGNLQYSTTFTYASTSNLYDSYFTSEYKYKGIGGSFGIISPDFSKLLNLKDISDLRLSLSYELYGNVNTDTTLIGNTSLGEKVFSSGLVKTKIPQKLGIALNVNISEYYILVLDYVYQPWSKFDQNGIKFNNLRDLSRYSIGFEIGEQSKRFATFWELIKYRGGLSYESSQYQFGNTGIDQLGFHAGLAFPLGLDNTIDIGFMYGIRGTKDFNLLKENIFEISVSLNFGELWFIRRER